MDTMYRRSSAFKATANNSNEQLAQSCAALSSRTPSTASSSLDLKASPVAGHEVVDRHFTLRSIILGLLIGTLLCFTNMYFGLQTGWISMMSLQSSLLGFAIFKPFQGRLKTPFGPVENVLVQTTAVATATMPLAAGFVGIIPALGLLEEKEGRVVLTFWEMIFWGMGIAFFGVFFAVPLRHQVIIKEKLRFPSGTATAQMIAVLHQQPLAVEPVMEEEEVDVNKDDRPALERGMSSKSRTRHDELSGLFDKENDQAAVWRQQWQALLISFIVSSLYTLLSHFLPVLNALPLLDWITAGAVPFAAWNWYLTPSLSYIGQGIIMGVPTTLAMLAGAIVGWGILGPISKANGWATGAINDQKTGPRGWILWVSLAVMISESLIGLGVVAIKECMKRWEARVEAKRNRRETQSLVVPDLAVETADVSSVPANWLVPTSWTLIGLFLSSVLCVVTASVLFAVPWYASILSVVLACLLSVLAVRALGETDMNPVSGIGKVSQFIFAGVVPGGLVANLVAGGIAEAGAQQAGDMMQDLKTGHLLGASPRAQFYGQLVGSFFSVIISAVAYMMYTTVYTIPGPEFQVPTAYVWLDMARLVNGEHLPTNTMPFIISFAILFAIPPILELVRPNARWIKYLPSGVAFAIGMLITPNYVIPRVIGAVAGWLAVRRVPQRHRENRQVLVIVIASGLVLGEGTFSLVSMILKASGVGAASCIGCMRGLCGSCS